MTPSTKPRVRVLGVDPGTRRLGYGVVDVGRGGALTYVDCGVIEAPARKARVERLLEIGRELGAVIDELGPSAVAIEEAFYGKDVRSAIALGEARGVALLAAGLRGCALFGYPPATVKLAVVGHGAAAKGQVAYVVKALLGLRRAPEADAADALALAICHAHRVARRRASALP